jgi:hypothetical protein
MGRTHELRLRLHGDVCLWCDVSGRESRAVFFLVPLGLFALRLVISRSFDQLEYFSSSDLADGPSMPGRIVRPASARRLRAGLQRHDLELMAERGEPGGARPFGQVERDERKILRGVCAVSARRLVGGLAPGSIGRTPAANNPTHGRLTLVKSRGCIRSRKLSDTD